MKALCREKLLAIVIVLGFVCTAHAQEFVPGQVIVKLKPGKSSAVLGRVAAPGATSSAPVSKSAGGAMLVDLGEGVAVTSAVALLSLDSAVAYAEPNWIVHTAGIPNDPDQGLQWAWGVIQAYDAWDLEIGDASIVVSVNDTGIDTDHEDLLENVWVNVLEMGGNPGQDDDGNGYVDDIHGWNTFDDNGNPEDEFFHGTHVAGTVGAATDNHVGVAGTSWTTSLLPCKFLNSKGTGTIYDAIECIDYIIATKNNPASGADIRISNNSWVNNVYSQALKDAIQSATDEEILWVNAGGNKSENSDCFGEGAYPSAYNVEGIISVANTTSTDELASTSNYGAATVDIGAPGSWILSTWVNNQYGTISGTSMASPHVAGVAALIWARNPSLSMTAVREAILCTGDPIPDLDGKTRTGMRLNAYNAVIAALSGATCNDRDKDGTPDYADNCPYTWNDQSDADGKGVGDVCEPGGCSGGCS